MTKKELLEIESILRDIEDSEDKIDVIERLYSYIKCIYIEQCEKKLGHRPFDSE